MTRELRDHIASWPTWQRDLWLASIVFSVVVPGWIVLPPVARMWLVGCVVVAVVAGLVAWGLDLLRQVKLLEAECDAHAAENARLTATTVRVPLRVVPKIPVQREASDYDWPEADESWLDKITKPGGGWAL